jgi:hypothetical protein
MPNVRSIHRKEFRRMRSPGGNEFWMVIQRNYMLVHIEERAVALDLTYIKPARKVRIRHADLAGEGGVTHDEMRNMSPKQMIEYVIAFVDGE